MSDLNLSAVPGLSITAQLFLAGAAYGDSINVPEIGVTGEYAVDVPPGAEAGEYLVVFYSSGQKIGAGSLLWNGTAEISRTAWDAWNGLDIEPGFSPLETLKLIAAILAGKAQIVGDTVTFRNLGDTKDRVISTATTTGGRTSVDYDVS